MYIAKAIPQQIISAANNGSGLFRLTINSHGLNNGDTVFISGGLTGMNGTWTVANKTDNTIDLTGSTFATGYVSGATLFTRQRLRVTVAGTVSSGIDIVTDIKLLNVNGVVFSVRSALLKITSATTSTVLEGDLQYDQVVNLLSICSLEATNTLTVTITIVDHTGAIFRQAIAQLTAGEQFTLSSSGSSSKRTASGAIGSP